VSRRTAAGGTRSTEGEGGYALSVGRRVRVSERVSPPQFAGSLGTVMTVIRVSRTSDCPDSERHGMEGGNRDFEIGVRFGAVGSHKPAVWFLPGELIPCE